MSELLPCPMCGGEAKHCKGLMAFEDCEIQCQSCFLTTANFDEFGNEKGVYEQNEFLATNSWNSRTSAKQDDEQ